VAVLAGVLVVDPLSYAVQAYEYGSRAELAKLGFPLAWKGPAARFIIDKEPPLMDIGTVELAKRGVLKVVGRTSISDMRKDGTVQFADGRSGQFDAVIWCTGYKQFAGHRHFMDDELFETVGSGVDALVAKRILPGSEHPDVKGLWIVYGRLQMIRDGAKALSWRVARELGVSSPENDAVDAPSSLAEVAAKHAAAAALVYAARRGWAPAAKL